MTKPMNTKKIIQKIKEAEQDFEFYPTTKEIIEALYWDISGPIVDEKTYRANGERISLLDIGAGNCKLFETFKEIAESQPLLNEYYTHYSEDHEKYKNCSIKKVISTEHHMRFINVIISNELGEDSRERVDMHEFMLMMKNSSLDEINFKELEFTRDKINCSEKEALLSNITNYEIPTSCRNHRERLANRVIFEKYMAIEKSQILIDNMPEDVIVVGTDFYENTLIDKQASHIFCNPPYSDYSRWSERIIKESNAKVIYLVIPKRWGSQGNIAHAIKQRNATVSIVGNFDFLESEDREARAKVSLVKIDLRSCHKNRHGVKTKIDTVAIDPFNLWFNETFKINAAKISEPEYELNQRKAKEQKNKIENAIVNGSDLVSSLVELYNNELQKLNQNYLKLGELDSDLLKELNVNLKNLLAAFREKIVGLKTFYWREIFDNLSSITTRLTSRTREKLLATLMENTNIDFTTGNIRSVVIWVIKNSTKYFNSQMLQVYDDFTTEDGIRLYKSNSNFMNDTWRYCRSDKHKTEKYALDYRIVCHGYRSEYGSEIDKSTLSNAQRQYVKDIVVIAKNLGFAIDGIDYERLTLKDKHNTTFNPDKTEHYKVGTKTVDGKIEEVYCQTHIPNQNGEEIMEKDGVTYVYRKDQDNTWYQYKVNSTYKSGGSFYINLKTCEVLTMFLPLLEVTLMVMYTFNSTKTSSRN